MPPKKKANSAIKSDAYRHRNEKRKNIPSAKLSAEGEVPAAPKVTYYFNPHLSPGLLIDKSGKADLALAISAKAGKSLSPDERLLLKDALNQHQPWLEWAAKREEGPLFSVEPVVLHIHERISTQAILQAAKRESPQKDLFEDADLPYQQRVEFYKHDINWANRLILGDSLQVMSSLSTRENLAGQIQMIFMDPPYGIKFSSNFQSEVGRRDVKDRADDLSREAEMVKAYRDTWNLGVHSYLAYMRQRLVASKALLSPTGSIFVQISDENLHRVRLLMDEVFGAENYCMQIAFAKTSSQTSDFPPSTADYLLWYCKDHSRVKVRKMYLKRGDDSVSLNTYRYRQHPSGWLTDSSDPSGKGDLLALDNPTSQSGGDSTQQTLHFQGKTFRPKGGRGWRTNETGLSRLIRAERLHVKGDNVFYKQYLKDFPVERLTAIWDDTQMGGFLKSERRLYVVQTAQLVIERCMSMTTDPGDLVFDPTCGSGTTAYVAEKWGRRWITADTSRVAVAVARQRLLSAKFDYYSLRDKTQGVLGKFECEKVAHVTLGGIAQNNNLDAILDKHEPLLLAALSKCNQALSAVTDAIRQKLAQKAIEAERTPRKRKLSDAEHRRLKLPEGKNKWEQWNVPFDSDPLWPKVLQDAVQEYRQRWGEKMADVARCTEDNAERVELFDYPVVEKDVLRVSGPFTVEGVRPPEVFQPGDSPANADLETDSRNLQAYLSRMHNLLTQDGVTFPNNKHAKFSRLEAIFNDSIGTGIHAEGSWDGGESSSTNGVAVAFGPQHGPVTAHQVEDLIRASRRYSELVIAGFSFDAAATEVIQESKHPKLKIHMAHIRPDVSPGMDGLLKDTPNSQLFTVFGQPEVSLHKVKDGEVEVELKGVDIYDPLKGEVNSCGAEKVAAWFLDSDYDGRCFCVTQAFFPNQDAWAKIAKALGSSADEEAFEAFKGTRSLAFKPGIRKKVAIKVIDPRGNEVMSIHSTDEAK